MSCRVSTSIFSSAIHNIKGHAWVVSHSLCPGLLVSGPQGLPRAFPWVGPKILVDLEGSEWAATVSCPWGEQLAIVCPGPAGLG